MSFSDQAKHSITAPLHNGAAVTVSDTTEFAPTRGLFVGVGGTIKVDLEDVDAITFTGVLGGVIYPLRVTRVYSTGTTASSIVALW